MAYGKAYFLGVAALLVAACGGSVFNKGEDGAGASGGSATQGGSSSHAGTHSSAGKAGSISSGGAVTTGGTGVGGTATMGGSVSVGGTANCFNVDCAYPVCDDGQMPVTPAGQCCPICPPPAPSCQGVSCEPVMECGAGYELKRPPGACCEGCFPKPGGVVACLELACPVGNNCPLGYVRGDEVGGCCYDCVPDRLFCNTTADCVIADRPRPCCGCPEAITRREYDEDACWFEPAMPRPIPQACQPQFMCDAVCGACPPPGKPLCAEHRCLQMGLK